MKKLLLLFLSCCLLGSLPAQNQPGRERWLLDAGFGMFIHWSMDAQLGIVISHSLVGASDDYVQRYFNELPQSFSPDDFDADRLAQLAKLAGMKYMVFTAKHHSGFCMWDTETTDFNIMQTPYGKDIVAQYAEAARRHGLAVGLYYSPEDFWFLHEEKQTIRRTRIDEIPEAVKERYIAYTQAQCRELLTQYGKIDLIFFDGGENLLIDALKPFCWELQPDLLITRGEIPTPEQYLPGIPSEQVWESCLTMGTQWQFKPTNEDYKSGTRIIELIIETRAKGGALLLNVGPDPYGVLPFEQERNLREVAAWHFVNREAVHGVRPWVITNEGNIWYVRKQDTVYAFLTGIPDWPRGARKEFTLASLRATPQTRVSILGQSDELVEYQPETDATTRFEQREDGLWVSCVRAQRLYNNHRWHNPLVLRLEHVEANLQPPRFETLSEVSRTAEGGHLLQARVMDLGDAERLEIGFQYRLRPETLNELSADGGWQDSEQVRCTAPGIISVTLPPLPAGTYQFRAVARHPRLDMPGDRRQFEVKE